MDIIEALEQKIFNFVKEWIEVRQRNNEPGQFYKVHTVDVVPFSNIIVINKATQNEVARKYGSFADKDFQKMLKLHKDYFVEAFFEDSKEPRIYKTPFQIDETFLNQNRMEYA